MRDHEVFVKSSEMELATFRFDVTPPLGHGCCGGWITPVEAVDDPLEVAMMGCRPLCFRSNCAPRYTCPVNDNL